MLDYQRVSNNDIMVIWPYAEIISVVSLKLSCWLMIIYGFLWVYLRKWAYHSEMIRRIWYFMGLFIFFVDHLGGELCIVATICLRPCNFNRDTSAGWWFGTLFFCSINIGNVIIPTEELIFFGGVGILPTRWLDMGCLHLGWNLLYSSIPYKKSHI